MAESSTWTLERIQHLALAWPAGIPAPEIMDALNRMPGGAFTRPDQIAEKARRIPVARPEWFKRQQRQDNCRKAAKRESKPIWTPERVAALTADWSAGVRNSDILLKLNELPGEKFTEGKQISVKADQLKIRRPEGYSQESALWSSARDEVLKARYPSSLTSDEIIAELNALPGSTIASRHQLADRAKILKVKRSEEGRRLSLAESRRKQLAKVEEKPPEPPKPPRILAKLPPKSPIKVPLHIVYNQGFQLWQAGYLPVDKRDDIEAINKAMRRAEPGHPGFQLVTRWFGA